MTSFVSKRTDTAKIHRAKWVLYILQWLSLFGLVTILVETTDDGWLILAGVVCAVVFGFTSFARGDLDRL